MKGTFLRVIAFIVCLLMMAGAAINVNKKIFGIELNKPDEKEVADSIQSIIIDESGNAVINTSGLSDATGFAGKTPLEIVVSPEGVVSGVKPLENSETPGFFKRASALLDNWKGKKVDEALKMNVDAVTGATMSSNALKDNMVKGLELYSAEIENINAKANAGGMPWKLWVALGVTLVACVVPLFVKNRKYHMVQMILNVCVLGFWCGQFISYRLMLNWLSSGFEIWSGLIPILMLTAAFIYPIFGKRQHYCSHICPLGSLQQLAGMCSKKKIKMSSGLTKGLEWFRKILWAVLMVCLWLPVLTEWMDYELFSVFMVESASPMILTCGGVIAILSVFINRPYCRFICPTGTLMKMEENFGN